MLRILHELRRDVAEQPVLCEHGNIPQVNHALRGTGRNEIRICVPVDVNKDAVKLQALYKKLINAKLILSRIEASSLA